MRNAVVLVGGLLCLGVGSEARSSSARDDNLLKFETMFGVRGLVPTGANPVANFRGLVSCQSIDGTGAPSIVNVSTGDFPASPAGDAEIEADVELPNPCLAPIVFVTSPSGRWFAVTGR